MTMAPEWNTALHVISRLLQVNHYLSTIIRFRLTHTHTGRHLSEISQFIVNWTVRELMKIINNKMRFKVMHRRLWISTNTVAEQQAFARFTSEIRHFIDAITTWTPCISSTSKYLFLYYTQSVWNVSKLLEPITTLFVQILTLSVSNIRKLSFMNNFWTK